MLSPVHRARMAIFKNSELIINRMDNGTISATPSMRWSYAFGLLPFLCDPLK